MRRSICELTKPSARRELRLAGISTSTTADVHIRVLTAAPRIKPTSTRCHSAWQPERGRGSTYRRGDFVKTSGTSSGIDILWPDGETEVIKGFITEDDAAKWIAEHSKGWQGNRNDNSPQTP